MWNFLIQLAIYGHVFQVWIKGTQEEMLVCYYNIQWKQVGPLLTASKGTELAALEDANMKHYAL